MTNIEKPVPEGSIEWRRRQAQKDKPPKSVPDLAVAEEQRRRQREESRLECERYQAAVVAEERIKRAQEAADRAAHESEGVEVRGSSEEGQERISQKAALKRLHDRSYAEDRVLRERQDAAIKAATEAKIKAVEAWRAERGLPPTEGGD